MASKRFKTFPKVYILDEHTLTDEGGPVAVVDRAQLEWIAKNNNERVDKTKDKTPVVIGHTKDNGREESQPEIVGWADNFVVIPFFDTNKYAIACDMHIKDEPAGRAEEIADCYPRRSVELWLKRHEIDPISLLGATTPERDLGPMQYTRKRSIVRDRDGTVIHYSRDSEGASMATEDNAPADGDTQLSEGEARVFQSSQWKEMQANMQQIMQMLQEVMQSEQGQQDPQEAQQPGDPSDPSADPNAQPQEPGDEYGQMFGGAKGGPGPEDKESRAAMGQSPVRYDDDMGGDDPSQYSGFGSPSATDGYIPNSAYAVAKAGKKKKVPMSRQSYSRYEDPLAPAYPEFEYTPPVIEEIDEKVARLERDFAIKLARQEAATKQSLAALTRENREIKMRYARKEAEVEVTALKARGFEFDMEALLDEVAPLDGKRPALDAEARKRKYSHIEKYNRQDPTAVEMPKVEATEVAFPKPGKPSTPELSRRDMEEVFKFMRRESIGDFAEARSKWQATQAKS